MQFILGMKCSFNIWPDISADSETDLRYVVVVEK